MTVPTEALVPCLLAAATVIVYDVPVVSPVNVAVSPSATTIVFVTAGTVSIVTTCCVIGENPLSVSVTSPVQVTVIEVVVLVAARAVTTPVGIVCATTRSVLGRLGVEVAIALVAETLASICTPAV